MPPLSRLLKSTTTSSPPSPHPLLAPPPPVAVDSDIVVILAALLCALICVVGLAFVARCACSRRSNPNSPPSNKGLKKKAIESLPKFPYHDKLSSLSECAICLEKFVQGEEVRVLPQCGHGFHVVCVDTWLGSHSSCPSCRRVLVVPPAAQPETSRCRMCGGDGQNSGGGTSTFLP